MIFPPQPHCKSQIFSPSSEITPFILSTITFPSLEYPSQEPLHRLPVTSTIEDIFPLVLSLTDSNTNAFATTPLGSSPLSCRPSTSATRVIKSKSSEIPFPVFPDTSTTGISPPIPSSKSPSLTISLFTFAISTSGRSTLLMTTIGLADECLIISIDSTV